MDGDPTPQLAISVRDGWLSHDRGKTYVLAGLNLRVPTGAVYSLLGPSGCGKTTVLSCIVGQKSLQMGSIDVNITSRLQLGYMPQEIAVYDELDVMETLEFFGCLVGLTREEVAARYQQLKDLLDLPDPHQRLATMSGGQKRRVSLGVALLRDPDLLVLDEPTVGLDSLLRHSIWQYLYHISKERGKTVLITTHYIEEARESNMVGFLSGGKLLAEASPAALMIQHNVSSLEQIHLSLTMTSTRVEKQPPQLTSNKDSLHSRKVYKDDTSFSYSRAKAFTVKSYSWAKRNTEMVAFTWLFPGLMLILFVLSTKNPTDLEVGYINRETICPRPDSEPPCLRPLSCAFLQELEKETVILIPFTEREEMLESVRRASYWGAMDIGKNFTLGVRKRLELFESMKKVIFNQDHEAGIFLDMTSYVVGLQLKKKIRDSYRRAVKQWYHVCQWNTESVKNVVHFHDPIYGSDDIEWSTTAAAGLSLMLLYTVSMTMGQITLFAEKDLGTLSRCRAAGLQMTELLAGDFISSLAMIMPPTVVMIAIIYLYSGPSEGPVLWLFILIFLNVCLGLLNGLLIGLAFSNVALSLLLSTGIETGLSYMAGVMWPVEGMTWILQIVVRYFPITRAMLSVNAMAGRGWSLDHPDVYLGFVTTIVWIVLFLLVMVFLARRKH